MTHASNELSSSPAPNAGLDNLIKAAIMIAEKDSATSAMSSLSEVSSSAPMSQTLSSARNQPHASSKPRSRQPKDRTTHNIKEKMRRDGMRSRLQVLRGELSLLDPEHDLSKLSCLQLLQRASTVIKDLEMREVALSATNQQIVEHGVRLRQQLGLAEDQVVIPAVSPAAVMKPPLAHEPECEDEINVTDEDDNEAGSNVSDSSRLRAVISATSGIAPLPTLTTVGMCLPARADIPIYQHFPMISVPDSRNATGYVYHQSVYGVPTAQTSSFTNVHVLPQSRHLFATMTQAQST